jgi:predicted nucleic acid-binding protein
LIDYIRNPTDPKLTSLFRTLPLAVCGVMRAELLHGVRNPRDRARLIVLLDAMTQLPIPETIWDRVGDHLADLRAGGITIPFPDAVIATTAIANGIEVWTRDPHFTLAQSILPALRLFSEPP